MRFVTIHHAKGFGLIEIMVTISIISVLSSVSAVATKQYRDKAKTAKVNQEVHQVEQALDIFRSTSDGFPNPEPGQRKLYCVGSTDCVLNGKSVPTQLNIETGEPGTGGMEFDSLTAFSDDAGIDQGYMYLSCGSEEMVCSEEDTALIWSDSDFDWYDWLGDDTFATGVEDNFDFWSFFGLNPNDYADYVENGEGESLSFVCDPDTFPHGSFDIYPPASTNNPLMESPYCSWDPQAGNYVCHSTSCEGSYAEFYGMVTAIYYAPYCGQAFGSQFNPSCIDFAGETRCRVPCED